MILIVIRSFNEEQNIGRLLSGIMQQAGRDEELRLACAGSEESVASNIVKVI